MTRSATLVVLLPTLALAQVSATGLARAPLTLNPAGRGGLAVGGADLLAPQDLRVAASLAYFAATPGEQHLAAAMSAAAAVRPWLELGATVPVVLLEGSSSQVRLGTPLLQARVGVLQERTGAPIDLGFTASLGVPLACPALAGELGVGAGHTLGPVRVATELGAQLRDEREGSRLLLAAGVSTVGGALRAEVSARTFIPLSQQPVSAEVLAGVRYAVHQLEFFALGGPGLGQVPSLRVVAGVSFGGAPDRLCSGRMQELACPRQDFDGDGVRNAVDRCPEEAAQTSDGCPAPKP